MRQHLATLCPLVLASGCSWLYNPDRIDEIVDAAIPDAPDAMVDADPSNLMLTGVESPPLVEGQGDEGSRPAVLVIRGSNIVSGATIAITPATGTALVEVVEDPVVSTQFDLIAVKVIARVDPDLAAGQMVDLVVKVTQPSPLGGTVEQMTMWQLKGLGELEGATQTVDTAAPREYSRVAVDTLNYSGSGKLIVRATASITVTNAINVSANGATPGPGAGAGGTGGTTESDGTGPGRGKKGVAGTSGGGGAGFSIAGEDGGGNAGSGGSQTGDVLITRYADNIGSGGGGSSYAGGGGGGTLELTAGGNLTINATILAKGANGGSGGLLGTTGGGGGSGGCVVLRSGATATVGGIDLGGGAPGTGTLAGKDGGAGRAGRARVDAAEVAGNLGTAHRGIMFDAASPIIVRESTPDVTVLGSTGDTFDVQRTSTSFAPLGDKQAIQFGGSTSITQALPALEPGFNRVCAVPADSGLGNPESRNCVDLAYVP